MIRLQTRSQSAGERKGIVAVLVAVSLFILVGALAFAIDGGYMFEKKHVVTAAAEASAYAAANLLFEHYDDWEGKDPEHKAYNLAQEYAAANGFGNGGKNTVTVNIPPASGDYAGKVGFVEVIIQHQFPQTFSSVFSRGSQTITGRAVAAGTMGSSKASILILEPKQEHTLAIKGASLKLAGDLVINSKSKKSTEFDKKAQLQADNVIISGGIDRKQRNNLDLDGELTTGAAPTVDPLAGLPEPTGLPKLKINDYLITAPNGQRSYDLPPGEYDGKIEFKKDDQVNLQSGTYKFNDELKFKDSSTVTGAGVTLYMDGKKSIKFETKGTVNLSPPTGGTYEGVTLFMDPTQKNKIYFKRDADLNISGSIYAPNGEVKFQQIDADLGFVDNDPDGDSESLDFSDDWLPETTGSVAAYIIARKLKIDKKSHVEILGAGIDVKAPFLGLVE